MTINQTNKKLITSDIMDICAPWGADIRSWVSFNKSTYVLGHSEEKIGNS